MRNGWSARQYWDFISFKSYADIKTESDRTYVGFAWWVAEPVLYMAIFYLVFAVVLGSRTENFIAFLLIGLTIWRWFQVTVMSGSVSISQARGIINQVYFPKIVLPVVSVVTNTIKFAVIFSLLIIFLWILGYPPSVSYLAVIVLLAVQAMLIVSVTLLMASLLPFLPDIRILLDNLLRGVFFMSGIFFDINNIDEPIKSYLFLNPMASLIHDYRMVLIYQQWPDWGNLLAVFLCSCLLLVISLFILNKYDRYYPRVVA